jgi:hypothetical protein
VSHAKHAHRRRSAPARAAHPTLWTVANCGCLHLLYCLRHPASAVCSPVSTAHGGPLHHLQLLRRVLRAAQLPPACRAHRRALKRRMSFQSCRTWAQPGPLHGRASKSGCAASHSEPQSSVCPPVMCAAMDGDQTYSFGIQLGADGRVEKVPPVARNAGSAASQHDGHLA